MVKIKNENAHKDVLKSNRLNGKINRLKYITIELQILDNFKNWKSTLQIMSQMNSKCKLRVK